MSDFRELYQQVIIDHGRHPRNFGELPQANYIKEGFNPLCGDQLTLYLHIQDDRIVDVKFSGTGCAISVASASLMTAAIKGQPLDVAEKIFADFHAVMTGNAIEEQKDRLGKLMVLAGVAEYPARVKCATLSWHTLHSAIQHDDALVTTE